VAVQPCSSINAQQHLLNGTSALPFVSKGHGIFTRASMMPATLCNLWIWFNHAQPDVFVGYSTKAETARAIMWVSEDGFIGPSVPGQDGWPGVRGSRGRSLSIAHRHAQWRTYLPGYGKGEDHCQLCNGQGIAHVWPASPLQFNYTYNRSSRNTRRWAGHRSTYARFSSMKATWRSKTIGNTPYHNIQLLKIPVTITLI